MSPKERAIREIAEARRRGDFEAVRRLLADDIVWHEPGTPTTPETMSVRRP